LSSRRDPAHFPDIQVDTPNLGSTQRISATYPTNANSATAQSGINTHYLSVRQT